MGVGQDYILSQADTQKEQKANIALQEVRCLKKVSLIQSLKSKSREVSYGKYGKLQKENQKMKSIR